MFIYYFLCRYITNILSQKIKKNYIQLYPNNVASNNSPFEYTIIFEKEIDNYENMIK